MWHWLDDSCLFEFIQLLFNMWSANVCHRSRLPIAWFSTSFEGYPRLDMSYIGNRDPLQTLPCVQVFQGLFCLDIHQRSLQTNTHRPPSIQQCRSVPLRMQRGSFSCWLWYRTSRLPMALQFLLYRCGDKRVFSNCTCLHRHDRYWALIDHHGECCCNIYIVPYYWVPGHGQFQSLP